MSYVKSSIFYLKDINDFLKDKYVQYNNNLDAYTADLKTNEKEVIPFLERVVMNRHNYELNKQRYYDDATSQMNYYKSSRTWMIIADVVMWIVIAYFVVNRLLKPGKPIDKFMMAISFITVAITINFGLVLGITSNANRADDFQGRMKMQVSAETNFDDFNKSEGVAMYYALKRNFSEPLTSASRKEIKTYYDKYVPKTTTATGASLNAYPSITQIIQTADWATLVNTARHGIITKFMTPDGKQSLHDDIDTALSYADNMTMLKEVLAQGNTMKTLVINTNSPAAPMSMSDIQGVINKEVLPILTINSTVNRLDGLKVKDPSRMMVIGANSQTVDDAETCLFNCELDDKCVVAAFNIPAKTCSLYGNKPTITDVLKPSVDDVMFVKNTGKSSNTYIEGGALQSAHSSKMWDIDGGDVGKCAESCFKNNECVAVNNTSDTQKCTISLSDVPIDVDNIGKSCDSTAGTCSLYKEDTTQIGRVLTNDAIVASLSSSMISRLATVLQKYNYAFTLIDSLDYMKKKLTSVYGYATYSQIEDALIAVIDQADKQAQAQNNSINAQQTTKYIPVAKFTEAFKSMQFKDFSNLYYSTSSVDKVINMLYLSVQNNVASNLSAEQNIFLAKDRELEHFRYIIINTSIIMFLCYVYYAAYQFKSLATKNQDKPFTFDKMLTKALMHATPILVIAFVIVLMVSWYKKSDALNSYNREILERNGQQLVSSLDDLNTQMADINASIMASSVKFSADTTLDKMNIDAAKIQQIYTSMTTSVDLLEKCNLLMEGADVELPFPWTDATINILLIVMCVVVLAVVYLQLDPIKKFKEIRTHNMDMKRVQMGIPIDTTPYIGAGNVADAENLDMNVTLKIVAFVVFIIMVIMFCSKLLRSSQDYKYGLYNSKYYEEARCAV